jgi:MoaA/NifB/PqqE/SkfB family radical SAM enzyme
VDEIHYLLGNSCNLNCQFCFWDLRLKDISLDKKKVVINEIKNSGIRKITISGGEPMCNNDVLSVLKYMKEGGFEVVLHTNGLLINREMVKILKPLVSRISLSLDGSSEKMMLKMRQNEKMYSHTVWLMKTLCELGIPVNVKTLITKINQNDMVNIGEVVSRYPVEYWSFLEFNPINKGLLNKDRFYLTPNEFGKVVKNTIKFFPNLRIKVRKFASNPDSYCFIASNGDVYRYMNGKGDILVGKIFDVGLKKILELIPLN